MATGDVPRILERRSSKWDEGGVSHPGVGDGSDVGDGSAWTGWDRTTGAGSAGAAPWPTVAVVIVGCFACTTTAGSFRMWPLPLLPLLLAPRGLREELLATVGQRWGGRVRGVGAGAQAASVSKESMVVMLAAVSKLGRGLLSVAAPRSAYRALSVLAREQPGGHGGDKENRRGAIVCNVYICLWFVLLERYRNHTREPHSEGTATV